MLYLPSKLMANDAGIQAPNSQTELSAGDVPASQVAKECLKLVEDYRKGSWRSSDKAATTRDLIESLTTSTLELSEADFNDSLGMYLSMLEQHNRSINDAAGVQRDGDHKEEGSPLDGRKRGIFPGAPDGSGKKQKQDDMDFLWVIREQFLDCQLDGSLTRTLKLLKAFPRDHKFTKSSIINSLQAPPFSHLEWLNIIAGTMVDLDHVISRSFAVTNDNRETESLRGMEVKFRITKPIKQVKTSGDWFIAWGIYSKAAVYVFPDRKEEFNDYGT